MEKILDGEMATLITASGRIVLTNEEVLNSKEPVIFFKHHTEEDDLQAVMKAKGIITIVGGTLSHASVVAREFRKACLINCKDLKIDLEKNQIEIKDKFFPAGTMVIVDGTTESVFLKNEN